MSGSSNEESDTVVEQGLLSPSSTVYHFPGHVIHSSQSPPGRGTPSISLQQVPENAGQISKHTAIDLIGTSLSRRIVSTECHLPQQHDQVTTTTTSLFDDHSPDSSELLAGGDSHCPEFIGNEEIISCGPHDATNMLVEFTKVKPKPAVIKALKEVQFTVKPPSDSYSGSLASSGSFSEGNKRDASTLLNYRKLPVSSTTVCKDSRILQSIHLSYSDPQSSQAFTDLNSALNPLNIDSSVPTDATSLIRMNDSKRQSMSSFLDSTLALLENEKNKASSEASVSRTLSNISQSELFSSPDDLSSAQNNVLQTSGDASVSPSSAPSAQTSTSCMVINGITSSKNSTSGLASAFTVIKDKHHSDLVTPNPIVARIEGQLITHEADSSGTDMKRKETRGMAAECAQVTEKSEQPLVKHEPQPESSSSQPAAAHVLCKVCINDKASGIHYGVHSCEGCKSFFRRSLHENSYLNFRCSRDGKCMVVRMTRNRCQYCRFKKCREVGMSRDSVRYGRLPPARQDKQGGNTEERCSEPLLPDLKLYQVLQCIVGISAAYHTHFDATEEKVTVIDRRTYSLIPNNDECTDLRVAMFQEFAEIIDPQLKQVIAFAKAIPGFQSFTQATQLKLLKAGFLPAWLLQTHRLFDIKERLLVVPDGRCVTKEELDYTLTVQGRNFLHTDLFFVNIMAEVSKYLFNLSQTLTTQLKLNDTETALVTALTLLNDDQLNERDKHDVGEVHSNVENSLKVQLSRKHRDTPTLYDNVMSFQQEVAYVVTLFKQQVAKFKPQHFKLPGLFVEMFELSPF